MQQNQAWNSNSWSNETTEIAKALCAFQHQIEGAPKDATNPFYKSKYADLESIWETIKEPLFKNGLSVTQTNSYITLEGQTPMTTLVTTLWHTSGQWITGEMPLLLKNLDSQGQGSAITYARRYALAALLGIYQTDDDCESAVRPSMTTTAQAATWKDVPLKGTQSWSKSAELTADDWARVKKIGLDNKWPESYMKMWIDRFKKKGYGNQATYEAALDRFSKPCDGVTEADPVKEEAEVS